MAESFGGRQRAYDIFIHDHYMIVRPVALVLNVVVFSLVAYGIVVFARALWSRHGSAAA